MGTGTVQAGYRSTRPYSKNYRRCAKQQAQGAVGQDQNSMAYKKYFCYEIYKNLAVWSANGHLGYNPCSFFEGYIKESDSLDLNTIWIGSERQELKNCVENDIPIAGCSRCYDAESAGLTSRRQHSTRLYEEYHKDTNIELDSPQGIDYSVGNLCNLKCVVCGPENSTQWVPDYQKINPTENIDYLKYQKYNQLEITDDRSLTNIINVHFHGGGEPLLSSHHVNLLKKIQQVKGLSDVRVFYNTNGTIKVSDSILALWEKCKLIELYFSIDDIGPRFNYQRTGADWEKVLKWNSKADIKVVARGDSGRNLRRKRTLGFDVEWTAFQHDK